MDSKEIKVWVDASSVAAGVAWGTNGMVIEDAYWLCPTNDAQHIYLSECDVALKGANLALQWEVTVLHLITDSACVHRWISAPVRWKKRKLGMKDNWNRLVMYCCS